jgi:pyridoxal/pyridoxine/pyridoxamine kinase
MEIPQAINELIAEAACQLGIPVFQDIGGEEREISNEYLQKCTYISPNLSELRRLTKLPTTNEEETPKKELTGYQKFVKEHMPILKAREDEKKDGETKKKASELMKEIGELWQAEKEANK